MRKLILLTSLLIALMLIGARVASADWPNEPILCDAQVCLPKWLPPWLGGGKCIDLCEGRPSK